MNIRPVLYIVGIFLSTLSIGMFIPLFIDLAADNPDWKAFFFCIIVTSFFGGTLILTNYSKQVSISVREAFLLTTASWITICLFAAIPFWLSDMNMSFTDSVFEAVSGITTTGSTVITDLNNAPPGILIWRSILQWLGGIGIIVMALSVLPFLNVGGMQLFRTESSENEKVLPRAAQLAGYIGMIYTGLTLICAYFYVLTGMSGFNAIAHAMTTIATGGFSTFDTSFAHYDHAGNEIVAIAFMIIGSLPFVLYLRAVRGEIMPIFKDTQVRWFITIVGLSILAVSIYLFLNLNLPLSEALRRASFNTVSLITGTGYTNGDYGLWGGFVVSLFFFLMVVGGCAGSTTCGIKIFRFQVLYAIASNQIKQLTHPHGVFIPYYNGKPIPDGAIISVMSFFFLYALCFSVLAVLLSFIGLDFLTAMSASATAISNVGPGLGDIIGPTGTFEPLPDSAKWLLSIGMILGRLELFTVLVLLSPKMWRN